MVKHIPKTDIETLIQLRLGYIAQETSLSDEDKEKLSSQLTNYFNAHLQDDSFTAYGYFIDDRIVSAAFLITNERPPGLNNINGMYGTVMNVFTYPEYQGKGYATAVMKHLIEDATQKGIKLLDLYATEAGEPLYKKLEFKEVEYTAMVLKL